MSKRKTLTLEQKVVLIKENENGHGLSVRQLAEKYSVSKSSVGNILQHREEYVTDYASNFNKEIKRKRNDGDGQMLDQLVFEWFTVQRSKHIPISGPILQAKARQIAEELGYDTDEFEASNGWLEKFRVRHAISFRTISDESASIDDSTVEEWSNRLQVIINGFDPKDIFNADETGLFCHATPDRSLVLSKEACEGGKNSKERLTILLCSNWSGDEKLKPLVIARSADQVSITVLDGIYWTDSSWKSITFSTIQNGFRAAGFVSSSPMPSHVIDDDAVAESDLESNDSNDYLQNLDSLLSHVMTGGRRLTAAQFVDIDACILSFNEWNDVDQPSDSFYLVPEDENDEEEVVPMESCPSLPEELEMIRKLHLFASTQQPQLYNTISDLETQLTDVYLDSKGVKQIQRSMNQIRIPINSQDQQTASSSEASIVGSTWQNGTKTDINLEPIAFIWLDSQKQSTAVFIGALRAINDCVRVYHDIASCLDILKVSKEKIFFISSSTEEKLIGTLQANDNIEVIFIQDADTNIVRNRYPKFRGSFTQHDELFRMLKETLELYEKIRLDTFLFKDDNLFPSLQLWKEAVQTARRQNSAGEKSKLMALARDYYRSNPRRLRAVEDFAQNYHWKDALHWCISEPFPSYLLRHALMTYEIDQLNVLAFLIQDILRVLQRKTKRRGKLEVYRGMKLEKQLVEYFAHGIDKIVSINGFFVCNKSRRNSLTLALSPSYRSDLSSVLFKIECISSVDIADSWIEYHGTNIVFEPGSTFRILCVIGEAPTIIKLKAVPGAGNKFAQRYRDAHAGHIVTVLDDQSLPPRPPPVTSFSTSSRKLTAQAIKKTMINEQKKSSNEIQADNYVKNGDIDQAIAAYQRIQPSSASIFIRIGDLYCDNKDDYLNALENYSQALELQKEAEEDMSDTYTRMGNASLGIETFDSAIEYYQHALNLCEEKNPVNTAAVATNLIGICNARRGQHELQQALECALKALELLESRKPVDENRIASTLATMANIYQEQGNHQQALTVGQQALVIFERIRSPDLAEVAALLNNLGAIQLSLGAIVEAYQYFQKSLDIYQRILPSDHPMLPKLSRNCDLTKAMVEKHATKE